MNETELMSTKIPTASDLARKQEVQQQQVAEDLRNKYNINFAATPYQLSVVDNLISNSENPAEEMPKYISALMFSTQNGYSVQDCYTNLDALSQEQLGRPFESTPTYMRALRNSYDFGAQSVALSKLQDKLAQAEINGEDVSDYETEIQERYSVMEQLQNDAPRWWGAELLKDSVQQFSYELGVAGTSTLASLAVRGALVAGAGLILGPGAVIPAALITKAAEGARVLSSMAYTLPVFRGNLYYTLTRELGIDKETAWKTSNITGWINSAIESELGAGALLAKAIAGPVIRRIGSKVTTELFSRGILGAVAAYAGTTLLGSGSEFVQEFSEDWVDYIGTKIASEASKQGVPFTKTVNEELKDSLRSGWAGFMNSMLMSSVSTGVGLRVQIKDSLALRDMAKQSKSKEVFKEASVKFMPDSAEKADWKKSMGEYWDSVNKGEAVVNGVKTEPINRLKNGSLYAQDTLVSKADESGTESRRYVVSNPKAENGVRGSKALLSIDYELSKDGNTIDITNVTDAGQESVTKEAIISLMEEYPNAKLSWETGENERLTGIKTDILNNPAIGQGVTKGRLTGAQREAVATKLSSAFTNLSNAEVSAALDVLDLMASSIGMSTSKFLATRFDETTFSAIATDVNSIGGVDAQSVKGYADFLQGGKAIVYAGEHADFSTFVHEVFHVYEKASDKITGLMEAVQKDKGTLKGYVATHLNLFSGGEFGSDYDSIVATINDAVDSWEKGKTTTETQSELMARLFEGYLKDGKTFNTKLDSMFARIKQWMSRVYRNMQGQVNLSDDIIKAFDAMLTEQEADENQVLTPTEEGVEIVNNEEQVLKQIDENYKPKETGIGYKVFYLKDGKLYPPMVANLDREGTAVGSWIIAEAGEPADKAQVDEEFADVPEYLRRYHVNAGGKGTHTGKQRLAYRPGWHLGQIPYAVQFNKGETIDSPIGALDKNGEVLKVKRYFPKDFVFAEVEYVKDKSYQAESDERMNYNKFGNKLKKGVNYQGGINHVPTDGYYIYRTNANPATDAWVITGAMKVTKVLTTDEVNELVTKAGRTPLEVEDGAKITEEMVAPINKTILKQMEQKSNQEILKAAGGKSLKEYTVEEKRAFIEEHTRESDYIQNEDNPNVFVSKERIENANKSKQEQSKYNKELNSASDLASHGFKVFLLPENIIGTDGIIIDGKHPDGIVDGAFIDFKVNSSGRNNSFKSLIKEGVEQADIVYVKVNSNELINTKGISTPFQSLIGIISRESGVYQYGKYDGKTIVIAYENGRQTVYKIYNGAPVKGTPLVGVTRLSPLHTSNNTVKNENVKSQLYQRASAEIVNKISDLVNSALNPKISVARIRNILGMANDVDYTVHDIQRFIVEYYKTITNDAVNLSNLSDKKNIKNFARIYAKEIQSRLKYMPGDTPLGWYSKNVREALDYYSTVYPELVKDENKYPFLVALAITSQGETVENNSVVAGRVYEYYKEHGVFPTTKKAIGTSKWTAMSANFKKLNMILSMIDSPAEIKSLLLREFTARNIEELTGYSASGESKEELLPLSAMFGPKIGGAFLANLFGDYNRFTMDKWMARSLYRLTGKNAHDNEIAKLQNSIKNLRDELSASTQDIHYMYTLDGNQYKKIVLDEEYSLEDLLEDDDLIQSYAKKIDKVYSKSQEINGDSQTYHEQLRTTVTKAAKILAENKATSESFNSTERQFYRSVAAEIQKILDKALPHEGNHAVEIADIQAIMWYNEKNLYDKIQSQQKTSLGTSYSEAAKKFAIKRGVINEGETRDDLLGRLSDSRRKEQDLQVLERYDREVSVGGMQTDNEAELGGWRPSSRSELQWLLSNSKGVSRYYSDFRLDSNSHSLSWGSYSGEYFKSERYDRWNDLADAKDEKSEKERKKLNTYINSFSINKGKNKYVAKLKLSPSKEFRSNLFFALNRKDIGPLLQDMFELDSSDAQFFHDCISSAVNNLKLAGKSRKKKDQSTQHKGRWMRVDIHSVEDYKNCRLFLNKEGTAGFALKGEDIISVFSDPSVQKASFSILPAAVSAGGRTLDCYDGDLPLLYSKFGFEAVGKYSWNDEYWDATKWNKSILGTPDVVYMAYGLPSANALNYVSFTTDAKVTNVPYFKDSDNPEQMQQDVLEKEKETRILLQRSASEVKQSLNDLKKVESIARKAYISVLSNDERMRRFAQEAPTYDAFKRAVEKEILTGSARIPKVSLDDFARTTWAFVKEMGDSETSIYGNEKLYEFALQAEDWREVAQYIRESDKELLEKITSPSEVSKENWLRSEYEMANAKDSDTIFSAGTFLENEKQLTIIDNRRDKDFLQFVSTSDGMTKFEEAVGDKMPAGFGKEDFESKYDIISRDTRYARFLYADSTGDKRFEVGNVEGSMPEIYDPVGRMRYSMSEAERKVRELELKTENKELKDAIKNGNVEYINKLSDEIINSTAKDVEALASKVTELQNALTEAESQLKGSEEGEKLFKAVYSKLQAVTSELQDTKAKAKFDVQETKANEREKAKIALDEQKLNDQIKLEDQKAETEEAKTWEALNGKLASLKMDQARKLSEEVATLKNEVKGAKAKAVADRIQAVLDTKKAISDRQAEKKAARDLKATMQKLADYITSPTPKTVDVKIAKEIEQLVAQSGIDSNFRSQYVTLKTGDRISLDSLKQILEENGWDAVASDLTISTLNRLFTKPLNDWTLSDLEALAGQVQSLRELGKRVLAERKAREQAIVEQIQTSLRTSLKNSGHEPDDSLPGTLDYKDKAREGNAGRFRKVMLSTFNIEHVCKMLDNGQDNGFFFTALVRAKRLAQDAEFGAIEKRNATIAKALQDNGLTMTDLMRKVTVDGNSYAVSQLMYATLAERNERSLNAYMFGNLVSKREKTEFRESYEKSNEEGGVYLSPEEIDSYVNDDITRLGKERYAVVREIADSNLSAEERTVMEAIWTDMNSQLERINEVANSVYNLWVNAEDGYLPIQRIDNIDKAENAHQVMAEMFNANASIEENTGVFKGFTKNRITMNPINQNAINDDLVSVYHRSVSAQEHFIAFSALNKRWNAIFRGRSAIEVQDDVKTYWGRDWLDYLSKWMNSVITPQSMGEHNIFFRLLRGNPAAAYLAWKPSGIILQLITSPGPFLSELSPMALVSAEMHTATHFAEVEEFIFARSNFMKSRSANVFVEMQRKLSQNMRANKAEKVLNKVNEVGMQGLEMADKVSVYSGWMALYNKKLNQLGGIETEEVARQCAQYADDIVHKTQPLGDQTEIAPLFTEGNNIVKAVLQFQTSMNTIWNNITVDAFYDVKNAMDKNLSKEQRMIAFKRVAGLIGGYMLAGLILGAVADGYEPDKDDDKKVLRRSIYYTTTQLVGSIPMASSIFDAITSYWIAGDKKPYFSDSFYPGLTSIQRGVTSSEWSTRIKNVAYGAGVLVGAPVSGIKQAARAVEEKSFEPFIGR